MSTLVCSSIKPIYHTKLTTKRRARTTPITRASPEPVQDIKPVPEYRFAEVLNGRAAMQGFLWGSMNWMMTGDNIIQQVEDPVYAMAATSVVITLALASVFTVEDFTIEKIGVFTPEAELKNGRLAMLGFTTLLGLSAM
jgi:hypothetical protein